MVYAKAIGIINLLYKTLQDQSIAVPTTVHVAL